MTAVMNDLTPREKVTQRLVGIAALEKLIAQEKAALREEAKEAFTLPGQREVAQLNGVTLGNVRLDKATAGWKVTDPKALLEWVEATAPEHLVTRSVTDVASSYVASLLQLLQDSPDGAGNDEVGFLDPTTGEILKSPPGITYVKGEPRLVVTPTKEAPEMVRAALGATAGQLGIGQ